MLDGMGRGCSGVGGAALAAKEFSVDQLIDNSTNHFCYNRIYVYLNSETHKRANESTRDIGVGIVGKGLRCVLIMSSAHTNWETT